MNTRAHVMLWGTRIGAVEWDDASDRSVFAYDPDFLRYSIEPAPLTMPLRPGPIDFPDLNPATFHGLPGLLADSLPDDFGNALIDRWLVENGRPTGSMNAVERLLYTGRRGMGALEFEPEHEQVQPDQNNVVIETLVQLANDVLQNREALQGTLREDAKGKAELESLIRVGTSAGGARAKAVLSHNEDTGEFRSGQVDAGQGFQQWLMKFDGVSASGDHGLADPQGFTRLEYACYLLARDVGVEMTPCRLFEEGGRAHFMTRRFDRTGDGKKLHMLSLGAMRHFDFKRPRAHSYEQALETIRLLGLKQPTLDQMFLRAVLNIVIRNQDDHVKNTAFLMDRQGQWSLSPAFDVVYAYNPRGSWTNAHQMTANARADNFTRDDILALAEHADVKPAKAMKILNRVIEAARDWDRYARAAQVPPKLAKTAWSNFRFLEP